MNEFTVGADLRVEGYVVMQEMLQVLGLPEGYRRFKNPFETKKIGNTLFVRVSSIKDPMALRAASVCTNLDHLIPLTELILELAPSSKARRQSIKAEFEAEGRLHRVCNLLFVKIQLDAARLVNSPNLITQTLDVADDDDDFDITVKATQRIRIGGYR